jgi:hypothetical protein
MWVQSIYPANGLVNLSNIVQVKKMGSTKTYIQFKKSIESYIFWEYNTENERNREYEFIKEITEPKHIKRCN